jgi:O-antigen ligase
MNENYRFPILTIFVFCLYVFWGAFGIDLTLNPNVDRYPLHRVFIFITIFIFFLNARQVLNACLKNKIFIALIIYVLLTALWSFEILDTIKNFIFLLSVMFISIMTALAFANKRIILIRWLFWLFFLMTLASIATAILFPSIGVNLNDFGKPRWIGITTHPNALGVLSLVLIWLSSNLFFLTKSYFERLIILLAILTSFFILIKADSMTSLVTSIIIIAYICYCYIFEKINGYIKLLFFIGVLLVFLFVVTFYMDLSELVNLTLSSTGRNTTFTGRALLWQRAFVAVNNNIFFGYGFDGLQGLTEIYRLEMSHLHNGYIEVLVKGGVIAGILLTIVILNTFFHQLRIKLLHMQDFIFLNSGLVMILIHNITESSILRGLSALSIFMIFIVVATSLIEKNKTDLSL